mgnify:CR=1 FL=1|jgi:hypothetical protein
MFDQALRAYFVANVVLLVILAVTLPFQPRGSAAFAISIATLAVVVPSVVVSAGLLYFEVDLPTMG